MRERIGEGATLYRLFFPSSVRLPFLLNKKNLVCVCECICQLTSLHFTPHEIAHLVARINDLNRSLWSSHWQTRRIQKLRSSGISIFIVRHLKVIAMWFAYCGNIPFKIHTVYPDKLKFISLQVNHQMSWAHWTLELSACKKYFALTVKKNGIVCMASKCLRYLVFFLLG